ncbi:MAG: hypothetical protein HY927_01470 [Elusimicrobia bacterium]|nr:hypothetical protein [Elusimicrobiota bacterium]
MTLAELLICAALFMVIVGGAFELMTFGLKAHLRAAASTTLAAEDALVRQAVAGAVDGASQIAMPAPGSNSPVLTVLHNYDSSLGDRLASEAPVRFFHLCLDPGRGRLYRYDGTGTGFSLTCGLDPPEGVGRVLVAGGEGCRIRMDFSRPGGINNLVRMEFAITRRRAPSSAPETLSRSISAAIRHAIQ